MRSCVAADGADSFSIGLSHSDTLTVASRIIADVACNWSVVADGEVLFECPESPAAVKERQGEAPTDLAELAAKTNRLLSNFDTPGQAVGEEKIRNGNEDVPTKRPQTTSKSYLQYPKLDGIPEMKPCPSMMLKIHRELKGLLAQLEIFREESRAEKVRTFYQEHFPSIHEVCKEGIDDFMNHYFLPITVWADPDKRGKGKKVIEKALDCTLDTWNDDWVKFSPLLDPEKHFLGKDVNRPFKMIYPAETEARDKLIHLLSEDINRNRKYDNFQKLDANPRKDSKYKELWQQSILKNPNKNHVDALMVKRAGELRNEAQQINNKIRARASKVWSLYQGLTKIIEEKRELSHPDSTEDMMTFIDKNIEELILQTRAYYQTIRRILNGKPGEDIGEITLDPKDDITSSLEASAIRGELKLRQVK